MRPLVKRTPDGRRYTVPTQTPQPATDAVPQPASDQPAPQEPTPPKRPRGRRADFTAEQVRAIRAAYAAGRWTQSDLAYIHSVSKNTISRIVRYLDHAPQPRPQQQED